MIQTLIFDALMNNVAVSAIVDGRIYPVRLPREAVLPAVVYQIPTIEPVSSMSGDSGIDNVSVVINAWASEYDKAHELAFNCRKALVESGLRVITEGQNDTENIETRSYGIVLQMRIWSKSNIGPVPPGPLNPIDASDVVTDTSSFNKNLSSADTTVQKALETLDEMSMGGAETDPVFTASQAANIDADDITNLGNLSGTNTGDQVGDGVTITGSGTEADPFVSVGGNSTVVSNTAPSSPSDGMFWLDTVTNNLYCYRAGDWWNIGTLESADPVTGLTGQPIGLALVLTYA
jgi:hypothetical protein